MSRLFRALAIGLALPWTIAGCATSSPRVVDTGFRGGAPPIAVAPTAEAARITLNVDETVLPAPDMAVPADGSVRPLSEAECVARAAAASTLGDLLDAKANACCQGVPPRPAPPHHSHHDAATVIPAGEDLRVEILRTAALEARNASAGNALELYHRLEESVARRSVVLESLAAIKRATEEGDKIAKQDIAVPKDLEKLKARRIDLLSARGQLDEALARLSLELRHLLAMDEEDPGVAIRPVVDVRYQSHRVDPEAEVQIGLERRPEVQLMRRLDGALAPETLKTLGSPLAAISPLLAASCEPPTPTGHFALAGLQALLSPPRGDDGSTAGIRQTWDVYRTSREREIAKEIRAAALEVRSAVEQVGLATERLAYWQSEGVRIGRFAAQDINVFGEGVEAELQALDARSKLWEKVAAWRVALSKLRKAQYLLL